MIIIGEPKLKKEYTKVRLCADVELNETIKTLWFEFDESYAKYVVKDRCDAFLVALLPIALRKKKDIICNSTVSEELLHNIRTVLIPSLVKGSPNLYKTRVSADSNKKRIISAEAVGTGLALGPNSFHIISTYTEAEYPVYRLTHLLINDYTDKMSVKDDFKDKKNLHISDNIQVLKAIDYAQELELPYIHVKTNLLSEFDINYHQDHMYVNISSALILQKLFKTYFYGSTGWDYNHFSVKNADVRDCSVYGALLAEVLSTSNFMVKLEGGDKDMLEKLEDIVHYAPAQRLLHNCIKDDDKNCNVCYKCKRTLLALEAIDKTDYFSQVYDVEYFKNNKRSYLTYLEDSYEKGDRFIEPVYKAFEKRHMLTCSKPISHQSGLISPNNINTSALILKNLSTGKLLLSKQIKDILPAVALGKIVTALIALESGKTQLVADVSPEIFCGINRLSVYDLIRIMLITQNNDSADIIAETVCGSIDDFVVLMNNKMRAVHAYNTKFTNPCGSGSDNCTTADDVVKIMEYALRNLHLRKIFKLPSCSIYSGDTEHIFNTINPILKQNSPLYMPECIGAKYGMQGIFANHIAFFKKDDSVYLLVLLGIKDNKKQLTRFHDVKNVMSCIL